MKKLAKGFTLLELMIVVTLISILITIAVPNFLQSKLVANELNAIESLRAIAVAQSIYKRSDQDADGVYEFALPFTKLHDDDLVNVSLARAHLLGYPDGDGYIPYSGYIYYDNFAYEMPTDSGYQFVSVLADSDDVTSNVLHRFGAHAWPAGYNLSGRNAFCVDDQGNVWQRDVDPVDVLEPSYNYNCIYIAGNMQANAWIRPE